MYVLASDFFNLSANILQNIFTDSVMSWSLRIEILRPEISLKFISILGSHENETLKENPAKS